MKKSKWRQNSKNSANSDDLLNTDNYSKSSEELFKLQIPKFYKKNVDFNNPNDPLLLQVLPTKYELEDKDGFQLDPVSDLKNSPTKGLIHKYNGRVLLIATGICAINCRYCFRRNFPYSENYASAKQWRDSIDYIQNNSDIHEVILSGGDPLMLSTKSLKKLTDQLQLIDHVKTLRIHTRLPLVNPQRITENLINWLKDLKLNKVMVLHCNHPNELVGSLKKPLKKILKTNTTLFNQSVLLKDINDQVEILAKLSFRLFEFKIIPYYINLLDKAKGTHHFLIEKKQAISIIGELQEKLPGYLVPRLVQDISGKKSKTLVF